MKINGKKLAAGTVIAAALLCAVSVGVNAPGVSNVFAATVTESSDSSARPEKGEKPEQKGTRYVGKITSLTSSTITVTLGEMKQPEKPADDAAGTATDTAKEKKDRKPDRKPDSTAAGTTADGTAAQNGEKPADRPEMNPEDQVTLTSESKTITISDSTKFRSHKMKKAEGTETTAAETEETFTISDLAVDDYITFLADEDGTILEVSKGVGMGGHGGRGGHGGPRDGQKPEETTAAAE